MKTTRKYLWIALAVFLADRLSKLAAAGLTGRITLIPHVLGLRYAENTGMAFSLLSGRPWLLGILSLLLITGGYFLLRQYPLGPVSRTAAMLILGGAAGNMVDRFFTGYVTDMLEFLFMDFPIFNVADSALVIGCVLMVFTLWKYPQDWENRKQM